MDTDAEPSDHPHHFRLSQSLGVSVAFDAAKLRTLRIIERENVLK
jgi:hypothetical protein